MKCIIIEELANNWFYIFRRCAQKFKTLCNWVSLYSDTIFVKLLFLPLCPILPLKQIWAILPPSPRRCRWAPRGSLEQTFANSPGDDGDEDWDGDDVDHRQLCAKVLIQLHPSGKGLLSVEKESSWEGLISTPTTPTTPTIWPTRPPKLPRPTRLHCQYCQPVVPRQPGQNEDKAWAQQLRLVWLGHETKDSEQKKVKQQRIWGKKGIKNLKFWGKRFLKYWILIGICGSTWKSRAIFSTLADQENPTTVWGS